MMIRSLTIIVICTVACLTCANRITAVLIHPLNEAREVLAANSPVESTGPAVMRLQNGNGVTDLVLTSDEWRQLKLEPPRGHVVPARLVPKQVGPDMVSTLVISGAAQLQRREAAFPRLEQKGPGTPFVVALKAAGYGGLGLSFPLVFYIGAAYLLPAMKRYERQFLARAVGFGTVLFIAGILFAYFVMARLTIQASVQFSQWLGISTAIWFIEDYAGFILRLVFGVGIAFQLPVVLLALVSLGLVDWRQLNAFRPWWIVVNLVLSAILTPQDLTSMVLLALPLQILYEFSIGIAWLVDRKNRTLT